MTRDDVGINMMRRNKERKWKLRCLWWRLRKLRKYVNPALVITAALSATSGQSATAYTLNVSATEGGVADTTDQYSILVTDPLNNETTLTGTVPAAIPLTAGVTAGGYSYAVSVGGETGPILTFTRSAFAR